GGKRIACSMHRGCASAARALFPFKLLYGANGIPEETMNRVRVWLSALALLTVASLPVAAQVQTGSILVRVSDPQGSAVPGVSVTLASPVLVSGTMAGVTDTGGVNRFPSLQPGIYSVKLELQGFRTVLRENVQVVVGQTVPLDLQLSVATVAE